MQKTGINAVANKKNQIVIDDLRNAEKSDNGYDDNGYEKTNDQINHLRKEITFLKRKLESFKPKDLDGGVKPRDGEPCIIFGDGIRGGRGVYCAATDRFLLDSLIPSVKECNPRKYFELSLLEKHAVGDYFDKLEL